YHDMYSKDDVVPAKRSEAELDDANGLMTAFRTRMGAKTFSKDEAREKVIPVYMGLITQIDDQLGILFDFMEKRGLLDNTMIVFTADHGDYLGDHWMGDKEYFHDPSVKVPLIIADPDSAADATRGTTDDALIECVDLLPTFLDYAGGEIPPNILDGRSLLPKLQGKVPAWRDFAVSESDYSFQLFGLEDGRTPLDCRSYMLVTDKWKYIYAPEFEPVLFDLENDPDELVDLGRSPDHADVRQDLFNKLAGWSLQYRQRTAFSEEKARHMSGIEEKMGVLIGYWNETDAAHLNQAVVPHDRPLPKPAAEPN
ncbi:MAG: sulfatase-like hydrolase/transferase, partial [Pseudomonadota bacterium]